MKRSILLIAISLCLVACEKQPTAEEISRDLTNHMFEIIDPNYPVNLEVVFIGGTYYIMDQGERKATDKKWRVIDGNEGTYLIIDTNTNIIKKESDSLYTCYALGTQKPTFRLKLIK